MIYSITITFNPDLGLLREQFRSLSGQLSKSIVVDNGSDNRVLIQNMFQDEFPNVKLISLPSNLGLACAQNIGIKDAIINNAKYVLLLDQDSVLKEGFVEGVHSEYINVNSNGVKVGAIGPVFFDPKTEVEYPSTKYRGPFIVRKTPDRCSEVTFLIASGCFFSTDVFKDVGEMSEDLFVDYIDVDWSLRCKAKGYKLYMTTSARMAHTIGDDRRSVFGRTVSVHSPLRRYFLVRNSFYMLRKEYVPLGYKLRELTFNLLRIAVGLVFTSDRYSTLKYTVMGIKDGVLGKFGPLR